MELCLGPGLSSTSPSNNSKTIYNHVDIHILVIAIKKEPLSFWFHYSCYVLFPGILLEVMQMRNHCFGQKKAMCKNIIVIIISQRQITIF